MSGRGGRARKTENIKNGVRGGRRELLDDGQTERCLDAAVGILSGLRVTYTEAQGYVVAEILHRFFARRMRGARASKELGRRIEDAAGRLFEESETFIEQLNEAREELKREREKSEENVMFK